MRKDRVKKSVCMIGTALIVSQLAGCAGYQEYRKDYEEFQEYKKYKQELEEGTEASVSETEETESAAQDQINGEGAASENVPQETGESSSEQPEPESSFQPLTAEEIAVRKALQQTYIKERNEVYALPASYEKTLKINELDKKILENAYCSLTDKQVVFIGDSITEGVGGNLDPNGNKISYVNYVDEALDFKAVLNHGKAGRTVTNYGDVELSLDADIDNLINIDCDPVVIFIGLNDYLYYSKEKRYGALDNGSTAGYCGAIQSFVEAIERNYPDKEYFFVTTYPILSTDASTYTDYEGTPSFNDYMEIQRILAERYGYHIIDIYNSGFLSTQDAVTTANLVPDGIHPNDTGYRMLGEHIAAELLLYYEDAMTE